MIERTIHLDGRRNCRHDSGVSAKIEQLRLAVEAMHHCMARHRAATPILEIFRSQKVWEGVVEPFTLSGHPKARRCYAWSFVDNGKTQYVTALEIPPVKSPLTAVRAAIMADSEREEMNKKQLCIQASKFVQIVVNG